MKSITVGPFDVELHPAKTNKCDCCNSLNRSLLRFVTREGEPHAIYYALLSSHYDLPVHVMATFGDFSDESSSEDRFSLAFDLWTDPDNICTSVIDPADSPWSDIKGNKLPKDQALQFMQHSKFELSTLISTYDPPVAAYLRGKPYSEGIVGKIKNFLNRNA